MSAKGTPRRRVTLADVARQAGVSTASASYALNGAPGVSHNVRERILAVAAELNFRPNQAARDLRVGSARSIGLLIDDIANPAHTEVSRGAAKVAVERGYEVFVSHLGEGADRQRKVALTHVDRNTSGLIFTSLTEEDRPLLHTLTTANVPYAQVYRRIGGIEADWAGIDDYHAAYQLATRVIATGCANIALMGGNRASSTVADRVNGWRTALSDAGLTAVNTRSVFGGLSRQDGYVRAQRILRRFPDVEAILAGNDITAVGIMDFARAAGISIPADLTVTGFDDMAFASAGPLQLTTVAVPREQMGECAANMVIDRINGFAGPARSHILRHRLVIRDTTRPE